MINMSEARMTGNAANPTDEQGQPGLEAQDDAELEAPQDETRRDEEDLFQSRRPLVVSPKRVYGYTEYLASLSLLGIFSFFGTLIRLGLIAIGSYNGQSIFPLLWAQMVGCCLMGMFTVRKRCIEEIYIPLYVGLTTGLCGSITSFSSWMGDVFQAFSQIGMPAHGGFYNFMDGLGLTIVTLAASSGAFVLGTQVGPIILHPRGLHFIARWVRLNRYGRFSPERQLDTTPREKTTYSDCEPTSNGRCKTDHHAHTIAVEDLKPNYPAWLQLQLCLLFTLMWLATILISVYVPKWRGIVSFALVMSPIGVWLRFHLARANLRYDSFPLGTFLANTIGTALLGMLLALQYTPGRSLLQCQMIQGLDDGFCGTLTTVSTFIVELKKLERKHAYRYAVGSWIAGQVLMLAILGSVDFARRGGLMDSKCAIRA